ncbi:ATP-binding protein [Deltaproteobacteria bacterium Smac51]|nr:ATP-binding protein [Deltaproteobacteria bacterium Smac51]
MKSINLPARLEELARLNEFIAAELPAEARGFLGKIELAVEELLVNISEYAYRGRTGRAEIGCGTLQTNKGTAFQVTFRDWGEPFDPFTEASEPDLDGSLDDRPIGGLGLYLVRSTASVYRYTRDGDTNFVELSFDLTGEGA